jgi:hypothetical protein
VKDLHAAVPSLVQRRCVSCAVEYSTRTGEDDKSWSVAVSLPSQDEYSVVCTVDEEIERVST